MDNTVGSLTQLQRSVIIGSILGDGYVRIFKGRKDALLEINHSFKQKEYVDWKFSILRNICRSGPKMRKSNGNRIAYRFYSKQLPEITKLYKLFYQNKKKLIPSSLKLDPIILAIWFMDDGSRCGLSNYYLNTQQYDLEDQHKLISKLKILGLEVTLNKDKTYSRIRFLSSSIPRLKKLIARNIILSMNYKLSYNPVETERVSARVA
ncbi:MAG: LAGLIDADG endonuclease [bacterium]|nr:LAGLIDADG endonuclease [bacterium]